MASRGDRERGVDERDEHLHRAASVIEANPAKVGQAALREVVVVFGGFVVQ